MGSKISLCMIVRNEEANLPRCLESVKDVVYELIVVDTGSTDRSVEICRSFGAKIVEYEWNDDFAAARNAGLREAAGDWILWMDADEEMTASGREFLQAGALEQEEACLLNLHTIHFYDETADLQLSYQLEQARIFRNHIGLRFVGPIHEMLNVQEIFTAEEQDKATKSIPVQILHYGYMKSEELNRRKHERNKRILQQERERQLAANELNPWISYHLSSEYYRERDFTEAFALINESILGFIHKNLTPSSMAYKLKYAILIESGSASGAWPGIERAIEIYPDYVDLHFYKGVVLYSLERYEEARETFLHCLILGESDLKYLSMQGTGGYLSIYYQGLCAEKLGRIEEAKACFSEVLAHFPNYPLAVESLERLERKDGGERPDEAAQPPGPEHNRDNAGQEVEGQDEDSEIAVVSAISANDAGAAAEAAAKAAAGPGKRVLVASPIRQKPETLQYFLESLELIHKDGLTVDFMFIDDNDDAASSRLLADFQQRNGNVLIQLYEGDTEARYHRDETTHYWNHLLVDKVAAMKDSILDYMAAKNYDAVFMIDSDVLVHSDILHRLLASGKKIISNIFWTSWQKDTIPLPQVWMSDEYNFFQKHRSGPMSEEEKSAEVTGFIAKMKIPGIYEVGGLGACTLIDREAVDKGVRFERIKNLTFWGEDRHFCIRAAALGFALHVDTRKPAYHIYRDADLEGARQFLQELRSGGRTMKNKRPREQKDRTGVTISLCMILKDEAETIARCLDSVEGIADEIVIVDTGSTDGTKEIVGEYTDCIYDFQWRDDFSAARNYAFSKATQDYILWLDADDVIEEKDRERFLQLKKVLNPSVDSVMMHYVLSRDQYGKPTSSLKRNRLVKRSRGFRWIGAVHEYLEVFGSTFQSDIEISHKKEKRYTDRNLQIYRRRQAAGEEFPPRDVYYFGNELKDHAFYEEAVQQYEKFLSLQQGWIEDCIGACIKLADCYGSLYEYDRQFLSLVRTFSYTKPRAEACCRIGSFFMRDSRWHEAIYWFETATKLGPPPATGSLIDHASWTWLPHLQLCVCYDRLGNTEEAYKHNEIAFEMKPDHPSLIYNRSYFEKKFESMQQEKADV